MIIRPIWTAILNNKTGKNNTRMGIDHIYNNQGSMGKSCGGLMFHIYQEILKRKIIQTTSNSVGK